jgi:hypothetical protein
MFEEDDASFQLICFLALASYTCLHNQIMAFSAQVLFAHELCRDVVVCTLSSPPLGRELTGMSLTRDLFFHTGVAGVVSYAYSA